MWHDGSNSFHVDIFKFCTEYFTVRERHIYILCLYHDTITETVFIVRISDLCRKSWLKEGDTYQLGSHIENVEVL